MLLNTIPERQNPYNGKSLAKVLLMLVIDFIIILLILSPAGYLYKWGSPIERGFFCNDQAINLNIQSHEAVTKLALHLLVLLLPVIIVAIVELLFLHTMSDSRLKESELPALQLGRFTVHPVIVSSIQALINYAAGFCVVLTSSECIKYAVGSLAPNFVAQCKPDWSLVECTTTQGKNVLENFITDAHCTGEQSAITAARKSFPSTHASLMFYFALFFILYVQHRLIWKRIHFLRLLVQLALVAAAVYTAITQYTEHRHHLRDLVAGAILGSLVAVIIVIWVWKLRSAYIQLKKKIRRHELFSNMLANNNFGRNVDTDEEQLDNTNIASGSNEGLNPNEV